MGYQEKLMEILFYLQIGSFHPEASDPDVWTLNAYRDGPKSDDFEEMQIPVKDKKPVCFYGAYCYKKNPHPKHLEEFQHPPKVDDD
jgi:hypothetical protein